MRFAPPSAITAAYDNTMYPSDSAAHTLRRISPDSPAPTFPGRAYESGDQDGSGAEAHIHQPSGIAIEDKGKPRIADTRNQTLHMLDKQGKVSTVAGIGARQETIPGQLPAGRTVGTERDCLSCAQAFRLDKLRQRAGIANAVKR